MTARVAIWVQHLLGSGHLRRIAAIGRAAAAQGLDITILSGGMPLPHLDHGAARLVQLPPLRTIDESFSGLADPTGAPATPDYIDTRLSQACAALRAYRPDLLITETYPFGRRQLRHEVLTLIDVARTGGARIACSVRDILQRPSKPQRHDEMLALALEHFDQVMVHADPRIVPFSLTFPHADLLGDRLVYTGYIAGKSGRPSSEGPGVGQVIVSVGGGATGLPLLTAALDARAKAKVAGNLVWRLLVGQDVDTAALAGRLSHPPEGVIVEPARPDFADLLANSAISISQAGYNTVVDVLAAGARAVLVPFARGGETEQTDRAERLADLGVAVMVEEQGLSPERLAEAVDEGLSLPRAQSFEVNLNGAAKSAAFMARWSGRG